MIGVSVKVFHQVHQRLSETVVEPQLVLQLVRPDGVIALYGKRVLKVTIVPRRDEGIPVGNGECDGIIVQVKIYILPVLYGELLLKTTIGLDHDGVSYIAEVRRHTKIEHRLGKVFYPSFNDKKPGL